MAHRVLPEAVDQVAHHMGEAFFNDPMFTYILPEPARRLAALKWFFKGGIHYGLAYGDVYTNADCEGGAIWLVPGHTTVTFMGMLRAGMLAAPIKFGWKSFDRFMNLSNATEAAHSKLLNYPHYYLLSLGISPKRQRQGIGSDLLRPILTKADQKHLPCYLETEQEANIAFYERHGFNVVYEGKVPYAGPKFWAMIRA